MKLSVARWVITLVALFVVGPLLAAWFGTVRAADGSHAISLLLSEAPGGAIFRAAVVLAIAGAIGVLAIMARSRDAGLTAAGLTIAWSAWTMGSLEDVLRVAGSLSPLKTLALEGLLVGLAGTALTLILHRFATLRDAHPPHFTHRTLLSTSSDTDKPAVAVAASLLAAIAAAALVAWLAAINPLKGQAIATAAMAALAAAAAAQLVATLFHARATSTAVMAAITIVAAAAPLIASIQSQGRGLEVLFSERLLAMARPVSLDWIAGAFIGIPIGLSWAEGLLDRHAEHA